MSHIAAFDDAHRLQQLIDRLPAMVAYWDADLRNVVANQAHWSFFGKTPDEIRGLHITELLVGELGEASLPYVDAAMAGEDQVFEKTLIDHTGVTRHVQAAYLPDVVDGQVQGLYIQVTDVTARVEAERSRDEAQRLFQISLDSAPFGKAVLTLDGHALYVNPALRQLLGHPSHAASVLKYDDGVHPDDLAAVQQDWHDLLSGAVSQTSTEVRYIKSDSTTIWVHRVAVLVPAGHDGADVVVAQFHDVTSRKFAEAELARLAVTDPLTGLYNRHSLVAGIADHRAAQPAAWLGAVFIDLDGFKQINDLHGHAAGDAVLEAASRRLGEAVSPPNSVYRFGGDEFVVLLVDGVAHDVVERLADDLIDVLSGSYLVDGAEVTLTVSVGWACSATADAAELIRQADASMYRHKGRNRSAAAVGRLT